MICKRKMLEKTIRRPRGRKMLSRMATVFTCRCCTMLQCQRPRVATASAATAWPMIENIMTRVRDKRVQETLVVVMRKFSLVPAYHHQRFVHIICGRKFPFSIFQAFLVQKQLGRSHSQHIKSNNAPAASTTIWR